MTSNETRTERDALGAFSVPADALYGIDTARAAQNFPISGLRLPRAFIRALGRIKVSAARANRDLELVDRNLAEAIMTAAAEVADGKWDEEFVVDVFQTGSGTSTNMNANEVIANRANELLGGGPRGVYAPVHPNDHVNRGQSSNDVIPTAIHLAAIVEASAQLRSVAITLLKIANDIRLMGSGPRAGLYELALPGLQPGSSIMPGKVNPVIPEAVVQVAAQVVGNDATIAMAGQWGFFELNTMMPVAAHNLLQSIELLANVGNTFAEKCIDGLEATENGPRMVEFGLSIGTPLANVIGYEKAAELANEAFASGRSIRDVAGERTELSAADLDRILDARKMTGDEFSR